MLSNRILISEKAILNNIHCLCSDRIAPIMVIDQNEKKHFFHQLTILNDINESIAEIVYKNEKPLSCGARLWIETRSKCHIFNQDHQLIEMTESSKKINKIHINKNFLKQNTNKIKSENITINDLKPVITCKEGSKKNHYGFSLVCGDVNNPSFKIEYFPFENEKIVISCNNYQSK